MEGYGQTEATAGITFSIAGDPSTGYTVIYTKNNFDYKLYTSLQMDNLTLLILVIIYLLMFSHSLFLSILKVNFCLNFNKLKYWCVNTSVFDMVLTNSWINLIFKYNSYLGHVGCPLPCCKVKLVDVPEMGYYAKDNKGEVCCLIY